MTRYLLLLLLPGVHPIQTYRTLHACALAGHAQHQAVHWRCFKETGKPLPRPVLGLQAE